MRVGYTRSHIAVWVVNLKNIKEEVFKLAEPYAAALGLELVEVEYVKKHDGMNLTLFIDKDGGVTINDCEALHRAIDAPLDDLDPTDGNSYTLNVSSLGLDRPLKTPRDFARNLDKEIEVVFYAPFDGSKKLVGVLQSFDDKSFVLKCGEKQYDIGYGLPANIKPVIKF